MSANEFGGLDLSIEPVRGVRSFLVDSLGRLTGISYQDVWRPGENVAVCHAHRDEAYRDAVRRMAMSVSVDTGRRGRKASRAMLEDAEAKSAAPEPVKPHNMADCGCGFYGYYDGSNDYRSEVRVSAVVEGYGEVVVGTRGFRASKARIVALCVKPGEETREVQVPQYGTYTLNLSPRRETTRLTETMAERVRRNYDGIPTFDSFDEMIAAFPPDYATGPTPETDPGFWTRVAP